MPTLDLITRALTCTVFYSPYSSIWKIGSAPGSCSIGCAHTLVNIKGGGAIRFENVTVPQGATITTAYLRPVSLVDISTTVVCVYITGNKETNPTWTMSLANYITRRGTVVGGANDSYLTAAQVAWDNISAWVAGIRYDSPEIKTIIQEIVDQAGWVSGNNLHLWLDDHNGRSTNVTNTNRLYIIANGLWDDPFDPDQVILHIEYIGTFVVQTNAATNIGSTYATLNGTLVSTGDGTAEVTHEYGLTTAYGTVVANQTKSAGETFSNLIASLKPATTYHFRARATKGGVDVYGSDLTFTTLGAAYPTSLAIRVGSLVHRVSPGDYNLEIVLGGLNSKYGLPIILKRPIPAIPIVEPETPKPIQTPIPPTTITFIPLQPIPISTVSDVVTSGPPKSITSPIIPTYPWWQFWHWFW